jgi:hypothetical protein
MRTISTRSLDVHKEHSLTNSLFLSTIVFSLITFPPPKLDVILKRRKSSWGISTFVFCTKLVSGGSYYIADNQIDAEHCCIRFSSAMKHGPWSGEPKSSFHESNCILKRKEQHVLQKPRQSNMRNFWYRRENSVDRGKQQKRKSTPLLLRNHCVRSNWICVVATSPIHFAQQLVLLPPLQRNCIFMMGGVCCWMPTLTI